MNAMPESIDNKKHNILMLYIWTSEHKTHCYSR